ncbi:hypothetical protein AGOR_G00057310 [Albula goreensis]|uniref:Phospholipase A2-like central domain-containing protein n=1 Tax=Albula goreensis TaxID=1534307 RepID=A0A8T3E2P1_9TELE|nr:hypothetical protein AGOR_G00057310 [Albula goreensis]
MSPDTVQGDGVNSRLGPQLISYVMTLCHRVSQGFRECLQGVNDTISHMVGYSFFNVLKVPCFEFTQRKHCTQLSWWGLCKSVQVAPYAVFRNSPLYHSSLKDQVDQESGVTRIPESTTATPRPSTTALGDGTLPPALACPTRGHKHKPPKPGRHCTLRGPLRGDTFWPSQKRGAAKGGANKGGPSRRGDHKGTPMGWKAGAKATNASPMHRTTAAVTTTPSTSTTPLDECRYKILPQEVKYGLRNEESKILYHCSCTRRLARQLRSLEEPSAVQSLLVDFVSLSCFTLPRIRHCPRQRRCLAGLSESAHLKRALKRMTGDPGGSTLKVKRQSTAKARDKGLPVNMYKRCLRITGKNGRAQG